MAEKQIGVTMILPTTPEGQAMLDKALLEFNSRLLACALNKLKNVPYEAKVRYIESLNGVVPWAKKAESE